MQVLVCDDDATVRVFLTAVFEAEGWDVEVAESGEQCLEVLDDGPQPDVLVLDQVMPGLQGTQVADRLRKRGFTRPIVLCSANLKTTPKRTISRLKLLTVNKIDATAVVRVAHAAVLEHQLTERPVERRRQVWPV